MVLIDETSRESVEYFICEACNGCGSFTIGDCEDGVEEDCDVCCGTGILEQDPDNIDVFVPERDALKPDAS